MAARWNIPIKIDKRYDVTDSDYYIVMEDTNTYLLYYNFCYNLYNTSVKTWIDSASTDYDIWEQWTVTSISDSAADIETPVTKFLQRGLRPWLTQAEKQRI